MIGKTSGVVFVLVILCAIGYGIEARSAGMGNLSLLFPDDFHRYDLYDYASIPAALMWNDTTTFTAIRLSGLQETWRHDSLRYLAIGEAFPRKLIDNTPLQAISYIYNALPVFNMSPADFVYSSSKTKETSGDFGNTKKPQAWRFYGNYGMLNQTRLGDSLTSRIKTPGFSFAYAKPVSKTLNYGLSGDLFYSSFTSGDGDDKATLLPIGAGGGIALNKSNISAGINVEYHYPMFKYSETWGTNTYSESFKGHAATPSVGAILKSGPVTWASTVHYTWMSLSGTSEGEDVGDVMITGYSGTTTVLISRGLIRGAVFGRYDTRTPKYTDETSNEWFKMTYTDLNGGAGVGMSQGKISAGFEGIVLQGQINDNLDNTSFKNRDLTGKAGVEYSIIKGLCARAGFNYGIYDPDLDGSGDKITSQSITGGFGVIALPGMRLDIAYNYRTATTETDPDEKITDHIVLLYFKYLIPEKEGFF